MSATSGIAPTKELTEAFAEAVESSSTRFLKISIQNETLVHDAAIPVSGSFADDLGVLQDDAVIPPDIPTYILAKLDNSAEWIAIFYVPDSARIRDKMLYAATRANLLKSLGSALFTDSVFATSKADLTADAYRAHQQHNTAPKPLSSREQELADLRQAENATSGYSGSRARVNHIGTGVGLDWAAEAEHAVTELAQEDGPNLVVLTIDTQSETVALGSKGHIAIGDLSSSLPSSEPSFALFAWVQADSKREILFIYSCPSDSPIKNRMIYSSSSTSTYQAAKTILTAASPNILFASRKVETSDPTELNEAFLKAELGADNAASGTTSTALPEKKLFARPKGPPRRR